MTAQAAPAPIPEAIARELVLSRRGAFVSSWPLEEGKLEFGSAPGSAIRLEGITGFPVSFDLIVRGETVYFYNNRNVDAVSIDGRHPHSTILVAGKTLRVGDYELIIRDRDAITAADVGDIRQLLHQRLIERLELKRIRIEEFKDEELRRRCARALDLLVSEIKIPSGVHLETLKKDVLNEALGLGPLQELLADESVTEIMVNAPDVIFVERRGKIEQTNTSFSSADQVFNVIQRIVSQVGRRVDESSPLVDARLLDGSRVNAAVPPVSLTGPIITIRKFSQRMFTVEDLIGFGTLTPAMAEFLRAMVEMRQNIVISGGTGSGKTSLLNVISSFIPMGERVVTIEDSAELRLPQKNLCRFEARPASVEGKGQVAIRDLVKNALRMRPDRIVVGECRGGEAVDMLQAMNTGHDGSLTTLHANSASDAVMRLETMVLMSGLELPLPVVRRQIASGVNFIIQQARLTDGKRRITAIEELIGIENGEVATRPVYVFERHGYDPQGGVLGCHRATGHIPRFLREAEEVGVVRLESLYQDIAESGASPFPPSTSS